MNIKKLCIRLLFIITASTAMFCINFFISWVGNVRFDSMMSATLPFILIASVGWLTFGIMADRIEQENAKRRMELKRAIHKKKNIIYLDSLIALGYYKKAC